MTGYRLYQVFILSVIFLSLLFLGLTGAFGHPYIIDIFHAHASTGSCK